PLEYLSLQHCYFTEDNIVKIIETYGQKLKVLKLEFIFCQLTKKFEDVIKDCPQLEILSLNGSSVSFQVCQQSWACAETLWSLDLRDIKRVKSQLGFKYNDDEKQHHFNNAKFVSQFRNLREFGLEPIPRLEFLVYLDSPPPTSSTSFNTS